MSDEEKQSKAQELEAAIETLSKRLKEHDDFDYGPTWLEKNRARLQFLFNENESTPINYTSTSIEVFVRTFIEQSYLAKHGQRKENYFEKKPDGYTK